MADSSDHAPLCNLCTSGDVLVDFIRRGISEGRERISLSDGGLPETMIRGKYTYELKWLDAGKARYESDDPARYVRGM